MRRSELTRGPGPKRTTPKRGRGFAASEAQRQKIHAHAVCVVCGRDAFEVRIDPAHVVSRTHSPEESPLDVVPMCRAHHDEYDLDRTLDLLPYLEPHHREELAQAVRRVGLLTALQRITNQRWRPEDAT